MLSDLRRRSGALFRTRDEIIDELMELYVSWRERAAAVTVAYDEWILAGTSTDRAAAFAAFGTVLDAEQLAADRLADFEAYARRVL
jgi:hypothetical protein